MIGSYKNKEVLYDLYVNKQMSTHEIAKMFDVVQGTIYTFIRKYNIPTRSMGEGQSIKRTNHCDVTPDLESLLYGELLGDGCMAQYSPFSASLFYSSLL